VRVGIIGTAELSETARSWIERNAVGVGGDETNRSFPGFVQERDDQPDRDDWPDGHAQPA